MWKPVSVGARFTDMVIGLGGKSCSGKNMMGEFLEEKGALHLDLDRTNHVLLDRFAAEIGELFDAEITDQTGGIDRPALSALVFSEPEKLSLLEHFIHPKIEEEVEKIIRDNQDKLIMVNGAALHKSRITGMLDGLVWMESPFILRLIRAARRDRRSLLNIMKRFRSQRGFNPQQFPSHVDIYKVYNGFSSQALRRRAENMYRRWIMKGDAK